MRQGIPGHRFPGTCPFAPIIPLARAISGATPVGRERVSPRVRIIPGVND